MFELNRIPGRTCSVDGKEFLFFSGYSYLGMNHVKDFTKLVKEGIDKYGILFPSSRISNTRLSLYKEFENDLSELTAMEDSVSFSSGFLAGKTISDILSSYKNILVAPDTHPAIAIKNKSKTNNTTFNEWNNDTVNFINTSDENEFVLISDSLNILTAEVHDFSFLKNIKENKKIIYLIDDSHGIGILGKNGAGIASELLKKINVEFIVCYSLSKAFNIEGGAISCSKEIADKLREHPNYSGSTAINPSLIHAFLKSEKLYSQQRERLFENIARFKKSLPADVLNKKNLPIIICKNENADDIFYKKNIIISSFGYPLPSSKKVNRIIINALHTKKDIRKLSQVFIENDL
jgi:7-keto-8-aminopelargonate synthetase-like enzyme